MTLSARAILVAVSVSAALLLPAAIRKPIRKPTYDPAVPVVELFDAIDRELVEVTVIARSAHDANLFVTNNSGAPVSVKLPEVMGAVHVLKQLAPLSGNGGAANAIGVGNGPGNGQAQPIGGGVQNRGTNGPGNFNLPGRPIFSIPSARTVQLPLKTVCLAYGRPDPQPKLQYRLVRLEEITSDTELKETLARYVAGEIDTQTTQAAAWHLQDGLSWKSMAQTRVGQIGGFPGDPLFTDQQLDDARRLVETIREKSAKVTGWETRAVSSRSKE